MSIPTSHVDVEKYYPVYKGKNIFQTLNKFLI